MVLRVRTQAVRALPRAVQERARDDRRPRRASRGLTRAVPNARPPRFQLSWRDADTLDVEYLSERKLIDVYVGLARGVGKYFKEALTVTKLSETHVQIVFGT
ncbi:MAG: hypothetical protein DI536_04470 [Archangium gephyra]|uniref:Heme NO-binding domain-containing protein n=1 Tax=Archangium gephyra TaxID=48 RepID=A0A2W5TWA5_9BACT|nr:MAG: hypothetical protein DI536_04470 [Archangium gephyra]